MNEHHTDCHGTGYAIWIGPHEESDEYYALSHCITAIAKANNTPTFVPHLTLLSGIKDDEPTVRERTKQLATLLHPFEVELKELEIGQTYFQTLFIKAKQTAELMAANQLAQEVCQRHKLYMPHASLAYGDFTALTLTKIKRDFENEFADVTGTTFTAHHLDLWITKGPIEHWSLLERFPLTPENTQ